MMIVYQIENANVEYNVEAGIVSYRGRRKRGLIQLWNGLRTLIIGRFD